MRNAASWAVLGTIGFSLLVAGGQEQLSSAAPPSSQPLVAEGAPDAAVAALITSLGDADYRVREKAGQALAAKGEAVLPDLRRAMNATDNPEIARRLTVLVRKMDYDRLVSPKRVTLTAKNKPIKEVYDEISKQTGYKIELQAGGPGTEGKYSFEFDGTPFWQVIDKVSETAGLTVYTDYDDEMVRINSYSDSHNPYVAYAGPFRVVASQINSSKNVQLAGLSRRGFNNSRSQEAINLNFQIQSEPKNPILGTLQTELISATDETGASLVPPKGDREYYSRSGYYNPGYRGHNAYGNLNLVRAARDAAKIKSLKGKIGIMLLAGTVPEIVINDPLKAKNTKHVGRSVELDYDSMTEANGQYSVALTAKKVGPQDPNQIDYNWSNTLWQKLELVDAKGGRYRCYGPNNVNNNGLSVQLTLPFGPDNRRGETKKLGPPVKLIYNEWMSVTHEVTFEFKDIPLP